MSLIRLTVFRAGCSASVVAFFATTALASSSNPKHFIGPNAVPVFGPNNYIVTFNGNGSIASYGTRDVTGSLNLWSVGSSFTTKQEWTNLDDNRINDTTAATDASTGFIHGAGSYTTPTLSPTLPGYITLSNNLYSSEGAYGAVATVANDGGPTGSLGGGTLLLMQTAAGINPDFRPVYNIGDVIAEQTETELGQIDPGVLSITKANGSALPATPQMLLFNKNFQISQTPTSFGNMPYQELLWGIWLDGWTGDVKVGWEMPIHTMFSSLRVDTAVGTMNGTSSLANFVLGPPPVAATLYWDIDGATAGAGGVAPSGNWNGTTSNFNTDVTGGAGGSLRAITTSADTVIFSAGSSAVGNYTVTVSGSRAATAVKFEEGNVTLTGGSLAAGSYDVASGATGTIGSAVTGGVVKTGAGTLTLTALNSFTGGTSVQDGTLEVKRLQENNALSIAAGAKLKVLDSSPTFPNHPAGNDTMVSQPSSLTIAPGGTLDLGNNDLILSYTGNSPIAAIEGLIAQGFNGGDWLGAGITSSTAASEDASGAFALAIIDNAELPQPYGASNGGVNFDGIDVPLSSILIKFTHRVDLNLDGLISDADAIILSTSYEAGADAHWAIGDVDYDGVFSDNDLIIFGTYYETSLQHLPEPAGLAAVACFVPGILRRRRN